ncbi:MAG TPA: nuclear transport factor 2 family protein [Luteimonas sp.]|nr:nuclear transport factor 2 family protein [Luteimonas sp.]
MPLSLPDAVARYFRASNGDATVALDDCFTDDAEVHDETHVHRGHAEIRAWKHAARGTFAYTVEPVDATRDGDRLTVSADVVGNFPGSPVRLDHVFELRDGRILSLAIG